MLLGAATAIFVFASLLKWGQLIKERICSSRSKFLSFRVDPILEGVNCPGKQTGSHRSCFPLKMEEKHGLPIHLNVSLKVVVLFL